MMFSKTVLISIVLFVKLNLGNSNFKGNSKCPRVLRRGLELSGFWTKDQKHLIKEALCFTVYWKISTHIKRIKRNKPKEIKQSKRKAKLQVYYKVIVLI